MSGSRRVVWGRVGIAGRDGPPPGWWRGKVVELCRQGGVTAPADQLAVVRWCLWEPVGAVDELSGIQARGVVEILQYRQRQGDFGEWVRARVAEAVVPPHRGV